MDNEIMEPLSQQRSTVLVTGAAGFIGSHMVDLLLRERWRVLGVDNFESSYDPDLKRRNITPQLRNHGYRLVEADVRDLDGLLQRLDEKIHVVIHIAALTGVAESVSEPLDTAAVNCAGVLNLLEFCRRRRVRQFVLASCGSVYGAAPGLPWSERDVPIPLNPLDGSRLAAEQFGHCYSRAYGIQFVAMRLFNVFGPREKPKAMISTLFRALLSGERLKLSGDANARVDFTYISDAVNSLRLAMSYGAVQSDVFNIGSGVAVTLRELVAEMEHVAGRQAAIQMVARSHRETLDSWADTAKAQRMLGYRSTVRLSAGLKKLLDWHLEQSQ